LEKRGRKKELQRRKKADRKRAGGEKMQKENAVGEKRQKERASGEIKG
jgi:hypothetical protein